MSNNLGSTVRGQLGKRFIVPGKAIRGNTYKLDRLEESK